MTCVGFRSVAIKMEWCDDGGGGGSDDGNGGGGCTVNSEKQNERKTSQLN